MKLTIFAVFVMLFFTGCRQLPASSKPDVEGRVDRCDRCWSLDSGADGLEDDEPADQSLKVVFEGDWTLQFLGEHSMVLRPLDSEDCSVTVHGRSGRTVGHELEFVRGATILE